MDPNFANMGQKRSLPRGTIFNVGINFDDRKLSARKWRQRLAEIGRLNLGWKNQLKLRGSDEINCSGEALCSRLNMGFYGSNFASNDRFETESCLVVKICEWARRLLNNNEATGVHFVPSLLFGLLVDPWRHEMSINATFCSSHIDAHKLVFSAVCLRYLL